MINLNDAKEEIIPKVLHSQLIFGPDTNHSSSTHYKSSCDERKVQASQEELQVKGKTGKEVAQALFGSPFREYHWSDRGNLLGCISGFIDLGDFGQVCEIASGLPRSTQNNKSDAKEVGLNSESSIRPLWTGQEHSIKPYPCSRVGYVSLSSIRDKENVDVSTC